MLEKISKKGKTLFFIKNLKIVNMMLYIISILIFNTISNINSQTLLTTHFIAEKSVGFQVLEYSYMLSKHLTDNVEDIENTLKAQLIIIQDLFSAAKFTGQTFEPLQSQVASIENIVVKLIETIQLIDTLADTSVTRTTRDTDSIDNFAKRSAPTEVCMLNTNLNTTLIKQNLVGFAETLIKIKTKIDTDENTLVTFKASALFFEISNLFANTYMLALDIKYEVDKSYSIMLSLLQHNINDHIRLKFQTLVCLKDDIEILKDVQVEECIQINRQLSCKFQLTLGKNPTVVYTLKPYRFQSCYINSIYYMDGQTNIYYKNDQSILTRSAPNLCVQAVLKVNQTAIRKNCPLNREEKTYEFGRKILVVHKLTDEITSNLLNNSIKIIHPPFTLKGGTYTMVLDSAKYEFKYSEQLLVQPTNLPFPSSTLCPLSPIESFFSQAYLDMHWPSFFMNLALLIITIILVIAM